MTIRTLVLSGGGGRGAFHAGVFKYLMQANKTGIEPNHADPWIPDIVVGTSIGAVNGAAIVQGISAADLETFWLSLREHDIQGIPPGMRFMARRVINRVMHRAIGTPLPRVEPAKALSPQIDECWLPLPFVPSWLNQRLIGRWNNLLDTGPLLQTLQERLHLDMQRIAASEKVLMINATNVRTGEGVVFCNRSQYSRMSSGTSLAGSDITLKRIIASCSIPLVYPWTTDDDGELYWDGAVVNNTPLGPAFEAARERPMEEPMEVVVVMMTPWWEYGEDAARQENVPCDFAEAVTWALDWALLASFRISLKNLRSFNNIAYQEIARGMLQSYRLVTDLIVAPDNFLPAARIIDYDEEASRRLIDVGYSATERAFQKAFATTQQMA